MGWDRALEAYASSSSFSHAAFLLWTDNDEVVSHPVNDRNLLELRQRTIKIIKFLDLDRSSNIISSYSLNSSYHLFTEVSFRLAFLEIRIKSLAKRVFISPSCFSGHSIAMARIINRKLEVYIKQLANASYVYYTCDYIFSFLLENIIEL